MNSTLQQALIDTLNYLMVLNEQGIQPEEAKADLSLLQKRHPDTELDLLWDEEGYDQSVHYDILLHHGMETVSLSLCPDRALPWPMRGVHRWSDADLVRVNNIVLKVDQAIAYLDFVWHEARIIEHLVNICLIQEALNKDPIALTDSELQLAMNGFCKEHKLYKVEEIDRWTERHSMTREKLARLVANAATIAKLRHRLTTGRIEGYFAEHRADFDAAYIARVEFSDEESAHRMYEQIRTGAVDFYEAAQHCFLTAAERSDLSGEIFAVLQRRQLTPELGLALFAATPGEVMEPVHIGGGSTIIHILSFAPARLDERTRTTIKTILFEEWLAERRQAATIEWNWGDASRTGHASRATESLTATPPSHTPSGLEQGRSVENYA